MGADSNVATSSKELRDLLAREFQSSEFRKMLKKRKPPVCVNCGDNESVEYHHIVPLLLGGTNNISNIVPLCHRCHEATHNGRHIHHYTNKKISGRPQYDGVDKDFALAVLNQYIFGLIGQNEARKRLNVSPKTKLADTSLYKKHKKTLGIKKHVNKIDWLCCSKIHQTLEDGRCIGFIEYNDGRIENLFYNANMSDFFTSKVER